LTVCQMPQKSGIETASHAIPTRNQLEGDGSTDPLSVVMTGLAQVQDGSQGRNNIPRA
jgi:hypothetical protein